jgi:hypothetical protein
MVLGEYAQSKVPFSVASTTVVESLKSVTSKRSTWCGRGPW